MNFTRDSFSLATLLFQWNSCACSCFFFFFVSDPIAILSILSNSAYCLFKFLLFLLSLFSHLFLFFLPLPAFGQLSVALNNTEHVRAYLSSLPRELDWRAVEQAMEESCGAEGKEQVNKALNGQLYNADLDLQREAKRLITHLTDKVL